MTQALELMTPQDGTGTEQVQAERALESRCCKEMAVIRNLNPWLGRRLVESILSTHELISSVLDRQTEEMRRKERKREEKEGVGKREGERKEKIQSLLPT